MTPSLAVPTIDLGSYLRPNASAEGKAKVIEQVRAACSEYGFFQVIGHGVAVSTQCQMLECCQTLFRLPQEQKEELSLKNSVARRGYERIGEQVLDSKALPDQKEGFYIGREVPVDDVSFLRGPNQWPDLPFTVFREPVTAYYQHMLRLGNALLEMLAIGLGHELQALDNFTKEPVVNLKLLHYPPHLSTDARQFGAGAHTDFGSITVLLQQPGKHGLQVYHQASGEWLAVPAVEDVLIVNIGDLINKWSGGRYSSTLHRVINTSDDDRYSVPCFYHGNLSATNPFEPGRTDGETVEEHIRRKFDTSYGLSAK
ncbi:hypothetical protein LTR08_005209 [Meristemomyces frigidus]|nr:hypothetical protein LTR08_005209 [Meristemomyces frigidus]